MSFTLFSLVYKTANLYRATVQSWHTFFGTAAELEALYVSIRQNKNTFYHFKTKKNEYATQSSHPVEVGSLLPWNAGIHLHEYKKSEPRNAQFDQSPLQNSWKIILKQNTQNTGLSKKMDGIWNRYNLKSTGRIYMFGILKCSEKFKVLDLP